MTRFRPPALSARIHGIESILTERIDAARHAALIADRFGEAHFAASLRGKARGYSEARDLIRALDRGHRLPQRWRWQPRPPTPVAGREDAASSAGGA